VIRELRAHPHEIWRASRKDEVGVGPNAQLQGGASACQQSTRVSTHSGHTIARRIIVPYRDGGRRSKSMVDSFWLASGSREACSPAPLFPSTLPEPLSAAVKTVSALLGDDRADGVCGAVETDGCLDGTANAEAGGTVVKAGRLSVTFEELLVSTAGCDNGRAWLMICAPVGYDALVLSCMHPTPGCSCLPLVKVPDRKSASGGALPREGGRSARLKAERVVIAGE
jgi:hypothetical protein